MDAEQARKVLGLQSNEDWSTHYASILVARQQMAELVRQAPTEILAQRYQEGLMEFDRALAFFREQQEIGADNVSANVPTQAARLSRRLAWLVILAMLLIASGLGGLHEWQRTQEDKRQVQVAQWEADAADHLAKRRWQEALECYEKIETVERGSSIGVKGRRSIEAGMAEEQEQYLGYWAGAAISAFEASQWADAEASMAKVFAVDPHHEEMSALGDKIRLTQTERLKKQWQEQAQAAMDKRDWATVLPWVEKLLEVEPQSEQSLAWKSTAELGIKTELEHQRQSADLLQQALALDQGVYNPQLLDRITRAKKLAPQNPTIAALYEKVANYGRTIRVPQEFSELQQALDAARDRDRVVLDPGTYEGSFSIKSALILEAASGEVILSCAAESGPALTLHKEAQGAKISGLQFHHATMAADAERYSTVLVVGAKVSFDACRFFRAAGHGLAVIQGGDVNVDDCRFEENGWDGISVQEAKSQAQIRNSVFVANIHHGIEVWNQASAVVENNRCADNCINGIHIDTVANVSVKTNQLSGNREYGIVIRAAGGGAIEGNRIAENLLGGMAIAAAAKEVACQKNVFGKCEGAALTLGKGLESGAYATNQFPTSSEKSVLSDVPME